MNILIVDDHLMTIEGYIALLAKEIALFTTLKALSCSEAYDHITTVAVLDLAIIDYQLPEYKAMKLYSGVDLALLVREWHPRCRVVIITAYQEATIIYDIYKQAQPDALVIKNDISYATFKECIRAKKQYLSTTAQKGIGVINNNQELLNDVNRQILFYLKQGFKINELDQHLPLSVSGIQKRITKMKVLFNVTDTNALIKEAILRGII